MSQAPAKSPQLQEITPPPSLAAEPLTPPSSDESFRQAPRVLAIFKACKEGHPTEFPPLTSFHLADGEYDEIERWLEHDDDLRGFVEDKIRYDYDTRERQLVIRMPSLKHEIFGQMVSDCIKEQLKDIAKGSDNPAKFARLIYAVGSGDQILPPGTKNKKSPDIQFAHEGAHYPGVVIEVSYSQKRRDLKRLAKDYILDSKMDIRVVVGLDIEHGPQASHTAKLSVWRPCIDYHSMKVRVAAEVDDVPFRDNDGNATNNSGMRVRLSEFAPEGTTPEMPEDEDPVIAISAQQLCEYLSKAERLASPERPRLRGPPCPGLNSEKTPSTSPERMTSDDERRIER